MSVQILVIEGLHPFFDDRVAELCDFKIYLDISDEVAFANCLATPRIQMLRTPAGSRASLRNTTQSAP